MFSRLSTSLILLLVPLGALGGEPSQAEDLELDAASSQTAASSSTAVPAPPAGPTNEELRRELSQLQARLAQLESAQAKSAATNAKTTQAASVITSPVVLAPRAGAEPSETDKSLGATVTQWGLRLSGYIQAQYQASQLSEDQLQQGGTPLNLDRFVIRRGRVRLVGEWQYVSTVFELDGSTTRGPFVGIRRAEAAFVLRQADLSLPPYLKLSAGLSDLPFGFELRQRQDDLLFMERTTGSLAFFPGPPDVGVQASGGWRSLRYALAVTNGSPLDDRAGALGIDATRAPDVLGRVGVDHRPSQSFQIAGGVSYLTGTGFSPGTDATKNQTSWLDFNENSAVDAGELVGVPGSAARPSSTFHRWAVGADFELYGRTRLGWSRFYTEATLASNLDRSLFVADPVFAGRDIRELSFYAAVTQELYRYVFIGLRYDLYNPDADFLVNQQGKAVASNQTINTFAPLLGAVWPGRGRIGLQYNFIQDNLARDSRGVPTNLRNNLWVLRVQADF